MYIQEAIEAAKLRVIEGSLARWLSWSDFNDRGEQCLTSPTTNTCACLVCKLEQKKTLLFFVDNFTWDNLELLIDPPKADTEKNLVGTFLVEQAWLFLEYYKNIEQLVGQKRLIRLVGPSKKHWTHWTHTQHTTRYMKQASCYMKYI